MTMKDASHDSVKMIEGEPYLRWRRLPVERVVIVHACLNEVCNNKGVMDPDDIEIRTQVFKTWVDLRIALSLWRNPVVMVTAKPGRWGMMGTEGERWSTWVDLFREVFGGGSTIPGIRSDVIMLEGELHWAEQKQRHNDPDANCWHHADGGWRTLAALWERTIIRQATLRRLISINPIAACDMQNTVLYESAHN